jgi:hypothetical protein
MKNSLQKIIDVLNEIETVTADLELGQLINDATLLLEGAIDRCTAIDEELAAMADAIRDEDEDALDPAERDEAIALANQLLAGLEDPADEAEALAQQWAEDHTWESEAWA